jgi:antitoxin PrlF
MKHTIIVSNRGQLTLPTNLRKRFGIKDGGPIILEERENELALKPAMVLEVEMYSDARIAEWDKSDRLDKSEKQRISKKLVKGKNIK